jgi:hypothetical protein
MKRYSVNSTQFATYQEAAAHACRLANSKNLPVNVHVEWLDTGYTKDYTYAPIQEEKRAEFLARAATVREAVFTSATSAAAFDLSTLQNIVASLKATVEQQALKIAALEEAAARATKAPKPHKAPKATVAQTLPDDPLPPM